MKPHIHFMGIGGVSMRALARHLEIEGHRVSGCDAVASAATEALRERGVRVDIGHGESHVAELGAGDVLVHTTAVPDPRDPASGREIEAAETRGVRVLRRIELLGELMGGRRSVGVTGTHGKSTTSAMVATLLIAADLDPAVQLGASLPQLGGNMRHGAGPMVAEVDESDPGFAAVPSSVALVTNLEDDHVAGDHPERRSYHASLADLENATRRFVAGADRAVWCADWPRLDELLGPVAADTPGGRLRYGFAADADVRIDALELGTHGSRFTLSTPDGAFPVTLSVPGRYNASNAAGALAAVVALGLDPAALAPALERFPGVGRRWQRWGERRGAWVIDDYAHHPTEVRATLGAARRSGRTVRAVLQPHRWVRTARLWRELADAAALADEVIVLDVYASGEQPVPGVGPEAIARRIREQGVAARYLATDEAIAYLEATIGEGDLVVTLGAGDVWRVAAALVEPERANSAPGASPPRGEEVNAGAER